MDKINLLDVVALLGDIPAEGLRRGEVGTVVEVLSEQSDLPKAYLVEFSGDDGAAYAFSALHADELIKLHYQKKDRPQPFQLDEAARALLNQGFSLLNNGDENEAERKLKLAIDIDQNSKKVILNSFLRSSEEIVNWESRIPSLRFLYRLAPDYERGRDNLAITYLNCGVERAKSGDIEAAQMFFNYAIAVDAAPDISSKVRENFAGVLTTLGIKAHVGKEYDNCVGFMRMACITYPARKTRHNLGLAHAFLALSYIEHEHFEAAIPVFEAAEETGLILPELLNNYAIALVFQGRLDEATLAFERALELAPESQLINENLSKLSKKEPSELLKSETIKAEYIHIPATVQQYQVAA